MGIQALGRVGMVVSFFALAGCGAAADTEEAFPAEEAEPGTLREALNGCPVVCGGTVFSTTSISGLCCRCYDSFFQTYDYGQFYSTGLNTYKCDLQKARGCFNSCSQPAPDGTQTVGACCKCGNRYGYYIPLGSTGAATCFPF
jgi:hypothetical protein